MGVSEAVLRELRLLCDGKCILCWRGPDGQENFVEVQAAHFTDSGICIECPEEVRPGSAIRIHVQDFLETPKFALTRKNGESQAPTGVEQASETDYYELLQISPNAEPETIHRVHRMMAARFHPDNPETGDVEKFLLMRTAYQALSDPKLRAGYDAARQRKLADPDPIFALKDFVVGLEAEVNRRLGVLSILYNQRRTTPEQPGVLLLELERQMGFPREHLEFTIWYLRSKKFIAVDDASAYTLTVLGADHVEANAPTNALLEQLLRRRSSWARSSPASMPDRRPALGQAQHRLDAARGQRNGE